MATSQRGRPNDRCWVDREGYRWETGKVDSGLEMRFHSDWWHIVFSGDDGHRVILGPTGIDLGTFTTLDEAKDRAEANARERSLNELAQARQAILRSECVLGALR